MQHVEELKNVNQPGVIAELAIHRPGLQLGIKKVRFTQWQDHFDVAYGSDLLLIRGQRPVWLILLLYGLANSCTTFITYRVDYVLLPRIQQLAANGGGAGRDVSDHIAFLTLFILPNLEELQINSKILNINWPSGAEMSAFLPTHLWNSHLLASHLFSNLKKLTLDGRAITLNQALFLMFLPQLKEVEISLVSHYQSEPPFDQLPYPTGYYSKIESLNLKTSAVTPAALKRFLGPLRQLHTFSLEYRLQQSDTGSAYPDHDRLHPLQLCLALAANVHIRERLLNLSLTLNAKRLDELRAGLSQWLIQSFELFEVLETLEVDFELYGWWWPKVRDSMDINNIKVNIAEDMYSSVEWAVEEYLKEAGVYFS